MKLFDWFLFGSVVYTIIVCLLFTTYLWWRGHDIYDYLVGAAMLTLAVTGVCLLKQAPLWRKDNGNQ